MADSYVHIDIYLKDPSQLEALRSHLLVKHNVYGIEVEPQYGRLSCHKRGKSLLRCIDAIKKQLRPFEYTSIHACYHR
jgi:hypothetical protein